MESAVRDLFFRRNNSFKRELFGMWPMAIASPKGTPVVLLCYYHAFHSNFLPWLINVLPFVSTELALSTLKENIDCEINDNHQAHLFNMINGLGIFSDPEMLHVEMMGCLSLVASEVVGVNFHIREPVFGLAFLATLEYLSMTFMHFFEPLVRVYELPVQEYVLRHGSADKKHADDLLRALEAEFEQRKNSTAYGVAKRELVEGMEHAHGLLRAIFSPSYGMFKP